MVFHNEKSGLVKAENYDVITNVPTTLSVQIDRPTQPTNPLSPIVEFDVSFPDSDVSDEIFLSVSEGGEE